MRLRILGICGTFMAGLAQLARELGHTVSGNDAQVYPPMSDFLRDTGITLHEGWDPASLDDDIDLVVIGNALSRGNPLVEAVLDRGLPYTSGAQWVGEHVLPGRTVVAVAGTHGKTTTTSLVTWLLESAGQDPGYLIGGIPQDFPAPARLGTGPFVIEADEYDTAFFDKRSKFVHYRPTVALLNNLEYDHADIFPDLAAIQRQFHHLLRTVPGRGAVVWNAEDANLAAVLAQGCWSQQESFGRAPGTWRAVEGPTRDFRVESPDGTSFELSPALAGAHNALNAAAALATLDRLGVPASSVSEGLRNFGGVKRRLEQLGEIDGIRVFDDFAHHPTAIATTLDGLRRKAQPGGRLFAIVELRSNSMRGGAHREALAASLQAAERTLVFVPPTTTWDVAGTLAPLGARLSLHPTTDDLIERLCVQARSGDDLLIMSNGGFEQIHTRLLTALAARSPA